jgi:transposase-like protein
MENKVSKLIKLIHKLPENRLDEITANVTKILDEEKGNGPLPECPECGSDKALRNGVRNNVQRYKCKACGKVFSGRHKSVMWHSHSGEAVWKQVIRDTAAGKSLDKTASELDLTHSTVFNMRHKALLAIENMCEQEPVILGGVCELDETYVLESRKGTKLPEDFWRKSRKHGAKAQKRGISNEQIAICTGLDRAGKVLARTVNRATPSALEVSEVFGGRIEDGSLVLTDGARSYNVLEELCKVDIANVNTDENKERHFLHINSANAFHSFIKERYDGYRGVATKYLNRYNALFSRIFRGDTDIIDDIYNALCSNKVNSFYSIEQVKLYNLLPL